jgi:hypothetical protein
MKYMAMAVTSACWTVLLTRSLSPAPAYRDQKNLPADTDGRIRGVAEQVADEDVIDHALQTGDDVLQHGRPRELPNGGTDGAFDEGAIERRLLFFQDRVRQTA